jgi:acyl-CoA thioester hydrolase
LKELQLADFPYTTFDKIRYSDTDRQGHVNNAAFSTYLETGRVEFLYDLTLHTLPKGATFVIAALNLNMKKEVTWPGRIDIGTGLTHIGNSSIRMYQRLYKDDVCVADAETVIVQVDALGQSLPLDEATKDAFKSLKLKDSF